MLKDIIQSIRFKWADEKGLTKQFKDLAPYFLYGGYIRVLDRYRIYIKRVEFYFHSEQPNGIKDEIVYHRNNYHVAGKLPYFKPLTFHAHASGYDIAFESDSDQYRASVLIREYEIYDEKSEENGNFLVWDKTIEKFIYSIDPSTNTQSTYLYDFLNGFGDAGAIEWRDDISSLFDKHDDLKIEKRQGVYSKDNKKWADVSKYDEKRNRKWSFSRKEYIPIK